MSKTVVVTIGRNVGSSPMDADTWLEFKSGVHDALMSVGALIVQRPWFTDEQDQLGLWDGESEDAATFVAFVRAKVIDELREELITQRVIFNQDAIGFIVVNGTDHII